MDTSGCTSHSSTSLSLLRRDEDTLAIGSCARSFLPVWLSPPCSVSTSKVGGVNKDSKVEGTESEGLGEGGDGTEDLGLITLEGSTASVVGLVSSVGCADSGTKGDCNCKSRE